MKVSFKLVLKSNAGYYVGRQVFDEDINAWVPFERLSDYFKTYDEADAHLLQTFNDKDYELVSCNGEWALVLVWVHPDLQITGYLDTIETYDDEETMNMNYVADAALYFYEHGYNKYYDPQLDMYCNLTYREPRG
jgi:hypothetical protein